MTTEIMNIQEVAINSSLIAPWKKCARMRVPMAILKKKPRTRKPRADSYVRKFFPSIVQRKPIITLDDIRFQKITRDYLTSIKEEEKEEEIIIWYPDDYDELTGELGVEFEEENDDYIANMFRLD